MDFITKCDWNIIAAIVSLHVLYEEYFGKISMKMNDRFSETEIIQNPFLSLVGKGTYVMN